MFKLTNYTWDKRFFSHSRKDHPQSLQSTNLPYWMITQMIWQLKVCIFVSKSQWNLRFLWKIWRLMRTMTMKMTLRNSASASKHQIITLQLTTQLLERMSCGSRERRITAHLPILLVSNQTLLIATKIKNFNRFSYKSLSSTIKMTRWMRRQDRMDIGLVVACIFDRHQGNTIIRLFIIDKFK